MKRGATRPRSREKQSQHVTRGARHTHHRSQLGVGGGGRGGAEACRLPQPCGPQTDPLALPHSLLPPPSPAAHGASITRPGGWGGLSHPHLQAKEDRGPVVTGVRGPPAWVCRVQGSPEAVSPRREGGQERGMGEVPAFDVDAAFPTSHVEVGGRRVAHAGAVGGHALVFALICLLAALDLQGACGERGESLASQGRPGGCWEGGPTVLASPVLVLGWAGDADEKSRANP